MKTNGAKNRSAKESATEESSLVPLLKKEFARWGLTALVSLWAFVLGILVGRGSAPVTFDIPKLEEKLAALKSAALEREKEHFEEMRLKPPDVGFHEKLKTGGAPETTFAEKSPRRDGQDMPPTSDNREDISGKSDSDEKRLGETETESRPEPKPLPEKVPAFKSKKDHLALKRKSAETSEQTREERPEPPKAAPKPTPKPPARKAATEGPTNRKSDKKVTIQVASFRRLDDARKVVSKLRGKGYGAYVVSGEVPGQGLYFRVKIGTFDNKAAAGDVMRGLRGEYPNCFLSRRD